MHVLIVGNSNSGKSWLARSIAAPLDADVIVFDPTMARGWPDHAAKYADPDAFFAHVETATNAYVFIDEAATLWDYDEERADALVYRGRHRGLLIFLIAQRSRMVRPNARNQCSRVYAFRQQLDDAKVLAAEYSAELIECTALEPVHCIATDGFKSQRLRLDFSSSPPKIAPVDGS